MATHFWTNCKACIPETINHLSSLNIEIRELSSIKTLLSYETVIQLLFEKDMGKAVDIIREDIVNLYGGFYSDLNYIVNKSPENLMKQFNFFVDATFDMSIENYMFAASPHHPIIEYALNTTLNFLNNPKELVGLDLEGCNMEELTNFLTYGTFVHAFINIANQYGTIDIALPSNDVFYSDFSFEKTDVFNDSLINDSEYQTCSLKVYDQYAQYAQNNQFRQKIIEYSNNEYFKDHMQCSLVKFGTDGSNGGTWVNLDNDIT